MKQLDIKTITALLPQKEWQTASSVLAPWANGKNVCIAGGIFSAHKYSDVDIYMYGIDENTMYKYIMSFMKHFKTNLDVYTHCVSAVIGGVNYQLITHRKATIESIIEDFDFDVCKIAYDFNTKLCYINSSKTLTELMSRKLLITKDNISPNFYYRFKKYVSRKKFDYEFDGVKRLTNNGYSVNIPLNGFTVIKLFGKIFMSPNIAKKNNYHGSGGVYLKIQITRDMTLRDIKEYDIVHDYDPTEGLMVLAGNMRDYVKPLS